MNNMCYEVVQMTMAEHKFQGSRGRLRALSCLNVNATHSIIYVHYFWAMEQSSSQYFSCTSSLFSEGKGKERETATFKSKIFAGIKWNQLKNNNNNNKNI